MCTLLFQLVTSVLLRKAYCQTYPWAQWLLLATLEILHGHAVPKLDSESLHVLQGTEKEESPVHVEDATLISNLNIRKDSSETSSYKEHNPEAEIDYENAAKKRKFSHCNDGKENFTIMNSSKDNENTFAGMILSDNIQDSGQKLKVSERNLHVSNSFTRKDFSVQVNPKIMKRTCNKWVQVKKFPQKTQGIQTEDSFWYAKDMSEMKDSETQTESKGSLGNRSTNDKETQTVIIYKKNSSVQYSRKSCSLKPKWKLIPVSGLPKKGVNSEEMQCKTDGLSKPEKPGDQTKLLIFPLANCASFSPRKPLVNNTVDPRRITDSTKLDFDKSGEETSSNADDCFLTPKKSKRILLFHGRPLIRSKSGKDAAAIPLEKINGIASIMLEDPRQDEFY